MDRLFDAAFGAALIGFSDEVAEYCTGISDTVAREYGIDYARMLQNRAKGFEAQEPRVPLGLFEPNRKLIRSTLDRMYRKYFPIKRASASH